MTNLYLIVKKRVFLLLNNKNGGDEYQVFSILRKRIINHIVEIFHCKGEVTNP